MIDIKDLRTEFTIRLYVHFAPEVAYCHSAQDLHICQYFRQNYYALMANVVTNFGFIQMHVILAFRVHFSRVRVGG